MVAIALLTAAATLWMADPVHAADVPVTGTFTGTGSLRTHPCSYLGVVAELDTDLTPLGATTIHLDFCIADAPPEFPVDGTFTLEAESGTLAGDLTGFVDPRGLGPEFPFVFDLSVTTATGALAGTTGVLTADGFFGIGALTVSGSVSGTLLLPNRTPATKRDCKHGGWRELVDANGRPFRNQGQCVRSVVVRADSRGPRGGCASIRVGIDPRTVAAPQVESVRGNKAIRARNSVTTTCAPVRAVSLDDFQPLRPETPQRRP